MVVTDDFGCRNIVVPDDFCCRNMVVPDDFCCRNIVVPDDFRCRNMVVTDDSEGSTMVVTYDFCGSNLVVVVTCRNNVFVNTDQPFFTKRRPHWLGRHQFFPDRRSNQHNPPSFAPATIRPRRFGSGALLLPPEH